MLFVVYGDMQKHMSLIKDRMKMCQDSLENIDCIVGNLRTS